MHVLQIIISQYKDFVCLYFSCSSLSLNLRPITTQLKTYNRELVNVNLNEIICISYLMSASSLFNDGRAKCRRNSREFVLFIHCIYMHMYVVFSLLQLAQHESRSCERVQ